MNVKFYSFKCNSDWSMSSGKRGKDETFQRLLGKRGRGGRERKGREVGEGEGEGGKVSQKFWRAEFFLFLRRCRNFLSSKLHFQLHEIASGGAGVGWGREGVGTG